MERAIGVVVRYVLIVCFWALPGAAEELLLQDFGTLKNLGSVGGEHVMPGTGRVAGSNDRMAGTAYVDRTNHVVVNVTVQTFTDSTWVLHEIEGQYRSKTGERINPNVSLVDGAGRRRFQLMVPTDLDPGGYVTWMAGDSTVVQVEFSFIGRGRTATIPQEIVDAYLQLYPSSLPDSIADTPAHHTQWVRDEMRRLLQYAGRDLGFAAAAQDASQRFAWLSSTKERLQQFATFQEAFYAAGSGVQFRYDVEHDNVTADGTSRDDAKLQKWLEQRQQDLSAWWSAHQTAPVLLPTPGAPPRATATVRWPPAVAATMRALLGTPVTPAVTPSVAP